MPLGRNFRGFPFEEEEGGAWSELAARHPDIAARLRPRQPAPTAPTNPASPTNPTGPNAQAFPRKRRPEHGDQQDFGANFDGFEQFPFQGIPPEFRGHFPPQWNRRFSEQPPQHPQHPQQPQHPPQRPQAPQPQKQTIATQTEPEQPVPHPIPLPHIPQGQPVSEPIPLPHLPHDRIPVEPVQQDPPGEDRGQRSVSAPPEQREAPTMSHPEQTHGEAGNVRIIPIQVEGRDGPVQRPVDPHPHPHAHPANPHVPHPHPHVPPPFEEGFHHPGFVPQPPFRAGFNTSPRPYTSQKAYPQAAYARSVSPQRSHSPKPQQEKYVEIPVQHEAKTEQRPTPQQQHQQQQQQYQQQQQQKFQQQQERPQSPPQPKQPPPQNDPITQILAIQTDVLNLMTEVENFTGSKRDKRYMFLDEMLTRNLLKLDNIETDGKENIRAARKEAIRCIQKCIAVLEAKAEKATQALAQDAEMQSQEEKGENGEVEMKPKEEAEQAEAKENTEGEPAPADARTDGADAKKESETQEKEKKGKKGGKNVKKRDKSKDNKSNSKDGKESMQVDSKGDKVDSPAQAMEVDAAGSQ